MVKNSKNTNSKAKSSIASGCCGGLKGAILAGVTIFFAVVTSVTAIAYGQLIRDERNNFEYNMDNMPTISGCSDLVDDDSKHDFELEEIDVVCEQIFLTRAEQLRQNKNLEIMQKKQTFTTIIVVFFVGAVLSAALDAIYIGINSRDEE